MKKVNILLLALVTLGVAIWISFSVGYDMAEDKWKKHMD